MEIDPHFALNLSSRLVAAGVGLWALELTWIRGEYAVYGAFSPAVVGPFRRYRRPLLWFDRITFPALIAQLLSSLVVVAFGPYRPVGRATLLVLVISFLLGRWRRFLGGDGAEQLAAIVLIATVLAVVPNPSDARIKLAVLFVAAQICLSYLTAGIAKLRGPLWRNGRALPAILATHGHGHPGLSDLLQSHPGVAFVAGWTVILFESIFPALLFGPLWLVFAALILGALFHISCAVFMGLNSFVWSFIGSYPCVLATAAMIHHSR